MRTLFSFLFFLSLIFFSLSCEKNDDGSFTPQEIFIDNTPVDTSFTIEDPCLTSSCGLYSMTIPAGNLNLEMEIYSSYDIFRTDAVWGELKGAIVVVHGNNRNADDYFNWMANAVLSMNKQNDIVFIAPHFKTSADVGGNSDLIYWLSTGWKRGFESSNITSDKVSSYEVVDMLLETLADKSHFPFLEKIIVTGHSSGAQLTDLYAAASPVGDTLVGVEVEYVVVNSQYFFYPGPERFDAGSNQFVVPTSCSNYMDWPYGTGSPTSYLSRSSDTEIRDRYVNRKVSYLLGTLDIFSDGTLNTNDCGAILLGENRFKRGENMFNYMENFHAGTNNHRKETVNNVGHNASQMYNSTTAKNLFVEILGN